MKNKKTLVVVIVIIVAVILLVVAGWLIYKKFINKNTEEKNDVPLSTDDSAETPVVVTDTNTQVVTPIVGAGPADVKAFQDWMDIYHPNWVKGKNLNKGSGYGTYGPSTQAAWGLWKVDFQKPTDPLETARLNCKSPNIWMGNYCKKPTSTTTTSTEIKVGDRVYTRSAGKTLLYKFPSYESGSEVGYLNTGTYNQGCNNANSVYVCMDKTIGSVLGVFPDSWTKVRIDVKRFSNGWTSTPQDFFVKSFQIVKR